MAGADAVIVGSGPNGLTAAARLALAGMRVKVVEAADEIGGGARTAPLTIDGFEHDVCSAIHPFGVVSPAFRALDLGIDWVTPPVAMSHPLDGGRVVALYNSVGATAEAMAPADARTWSKILGPLVDDLDAVIETFLAARIIPNPVSRANQVMTLLGARSAAHLAGRFSSTEARALIAGLAAHSVASLDAPFTSGVALLMGAVGNGIGWPLVQGGSGNLAESLVSKILRNGGEIVTGERVTDLDGYEGATVILDLSPPEARQVGRDRLGRFDSYAMSRWKPGPGVFKVDYALDAPVPWADPVSARAGTVHIGGTFEEIAAAEAAMFRGDHPDRPFVLFAQQADFDPSRAPEGKRTGWAYCHVPNGSKVDMTGRIEDQIDRFAPGFRDIVLHRFVRSAPGFESYNSNYVGGDIGGGRFSMTRFIPRLANPYRVGDRLYMCSSSTPPGGGAHGMCGWNAAGSVLRRHRVTGRTRAPRGG